MSDEFNSESLSNDFLLNGNPQSEFENSPKPTPGAPIFANRKVPADIQLIAQQAMFEHGKIHPEENDDGTELNFSTERLEKQANATPHVLVDQPIMPIAADLNMETESKASKPSVSKALKISKVRFIDNLPKKANDLSPNNIVKAKEPPISAVASVASVPPPESNASHIFKPNLADQPQKNPLPDKTVPEGKGYSSFREEIMARLRAETESYDEFISPTLSADKSAVAKNSEIPHSNLANPANPVNPVNSNPIEGFSHERPEELDEYDGAQATKKIELADLKIPTVHRHHNPLEAVAPEMSPALAKALATRNQENKEIIAEPTEQRVKINDEINQHPLNMSRKARNFDGEAEVKRLSKAEKRDKKKSKVHIGRSVAIILVVVLLALLGSGYYFVTSNLKAVNPSATNTELVSVPTGSSSKTVATLLEKDGLIKNAAVFNYYTMFKGLTNFKSGSYNLSKNMTPLQIAELLVKGGSAITGKITIPEGYTLDQIATAITVNADSKTSSATPFTKAEFMKIVTDSTFISEMKAKYPQLFVNLPSTDSGVKYQLEGYLFPATYSYSSGTSMKDIVEQMIKAMDQNMQPYYSKIASLNLNANQFISLAALVEKEANTADDRKNVADVFLKRLNEGMPLGSNVSLLYAEGKLGTNVSAADDANVDTTLDSPFNLYTNLGTGPGPVGSPSAMSLDAVMNYVSNSYYYFIADSTGTVHFEETAEEHSADVQQYLGGQ
ncbi:MAG: endolytic transglycosylase MltG [Streptococcaceae bacterium]|nr:endolytic transglycosylase MltG [Streptococcaceae bacterium]